MGNDAGRRVLAALVMLAALVGGCGKAEPRTLEEAIRRAVAEVHIGSPVEAFRGADGDRLMVVFLGRAGVLDGVGFVLIDREAPWAVHGSGVGDTNSVDPAFVHLTFSSGAGAVETIVYGRVNDQRIATLELDFPTGPVRIAARPPAYGAVIHGTSDPTLTWRFLSAAGLVIYAPFDAETSPGPASSGR
jgi:hypothetical protein